MTSPEPETNSTIPGPVFKILAIDGGGFKGLYTACVLRELEKHFGVLGDRFDMLCGTSTGALIVLPLSIGKSAAEIADFYKECGPKIFPDGGKVGTLRRWLRFAWHKSKYGDTALKQAAQHILGEHRMGDANALLCVPSFNFTSSRPRVFKTDHDGFLNRDSQLFMWEVAAATAAAPVFFPIATCQENDEPVYYIDGGIWANNPALVGLSEAARFFAGPGKPYGSVRILSLEGINPSSGRLASNSYPQSLLGFATELVDATMQGQQCSTEYFMRFLAPSLSFPVDYVRVEAPKISTKQARGVQLDMASRAAIQTLTNYGKDAGHAAKQRPEVQTFFENDARKLLRRNS